jgi:hypothetical protein
VAKDAPSDVSCCYRKHDDGAIPLEDRRPLFETRTVAGRPIASRWTETLPLGVSAVLLNLVVFVHVVGHQNTPNGPIDDQPIRDQAFVNDIFDTANHIWSQACIKLVPFMAAVVQTFQDLPISALAGTCLAPAQQALVAPLDVTLEGTTAINLYLVDDTTGDACGSSITGHVIMPTAGQLSSALGEVFAHEIGHVLLNPLGVDDSDNPDHLMHHPENHPNDPRGSRDGLFLSDCLGAHTRAVEDYPCWAPISAPIDPATQLCTMRPRLGNNLTVIEEMQM